MIKKSIYIFSFLLIIIFTHNESFAQSFFDKAKKKYEEKKFEDSKFLFHRDIVFNPKNAKSYLYLAKIFNTEENQKEEEKNLKSALLLEPSNEEAMYMLINIELKKSNYSEVKELKDKFLKICSSLCKKNKNIEETLKNIEPNNES